MFCDKFYNFFVFYVHWIPPQVIDTHAHLGGRSILEATFVQGTKVALLHTSGQKDFSINFTLVLEKENRRREPEVRELRTRTTIQHT